MRSSILDTIEDISEPSSFVPAQFYRKGEVPTAHHISSTVQDAWSQNDLVRRLQTDSKTNHGSSKEYVPNLFPYGVKKPPRAKKRGRKFKTEHLSFLRMSGVDGFYISKWPIIRRFHVSVILKDLHAKLYVTKIPLVSLFNNLSMESAALQFFDLQSNIKPEGADVH